MSTTPSIEELVTRGTAHLTDYLETHQTDSLRALAEIVVALRGSFTLDDGRRDWSGRSGPYRQAMATIYTRARVPVDKLDTIQAAIRYHVGNLLRERADPEDLAAVGLTTTSPKERLREGRAALQAQREVAAPRSDLAKLATYAQALLDVVDEEAIPSVPNERRIAAKIALERIQVRAAELLIRIRDAAGSVPDQRGRPRGHGLASV